jgi:hypothetical protein
MAEMNAASGARVNVTSAPGNTASQVRVDVAVGSVAIAKAEVAVVAINAMLGPSFTTLIWQSPDLTAMRLPSIGSPTAAEAVDVAEMLIHGEAV